MRVKMFAADSAAGIPIPRYDLAVVGEAVDDRGLAAITFARSVAAKTIVAKYHPHTLRIECDGCEMEPDDLATNFASAAGQRVLIETTTVGFAELFICCSVVRRLEHSTLSFLYVEPREYLRPDKKVIRQRDFELSEEIVGYKPIPGAIASLDQVAIGTDPESHNVVFLLGFEGQRMDRALEDLPIDPRRCYLVFGVPGFRPGWELDSFANNIRVLSDEEFHQEPQFCAADNPLAIMELLEAIHEGQSPDGELFVAPIGTKPHGIGAALFATEHNDVGLLYDHPRRKEGRSSHTGVWHLFVAEFAD